ncbi:unnamed protein product [Ceratitis capitata]|uniref:(Mediterranean fruit fly) hypothetical protein n=1 Tax=Ceratitis capitata TaxID=7213 RepID=A0A811UB74_CERCA|nr:unnamed protein product [Ceratitis capitata]
MHVTDNTSSIRRKKLRTCTFEDTDEVMLQWVFAARGRNLYGPKLREKVKQFAEALGHGEDKASVDWFENLKIVTALFKKHCVLKVLPPTSELELNG